MRWVESWIVDTVPAASLTSAHSPSGVIAAISGVWKRCRTATGRSPGQERSVTVPAAGLQTTTGPVGAAASVVLLDLEASYRVDEQAFHSRSVNSWLLGATMKGRVRATVAAGRLVYAA